MSPFEKPAMSNLGCTDGDEGSWSIGVNRGSNLFAMQPIEDEGSQTVRCTCAPGMPCLMLILCLLVHLSLVVLIRAILWRSFSLYSEGLLIAYNISYRAQQWQGRKFRRLTSNVYWSFILCFVTQVMLALVRLHICSAHSTYWFLHTVGSIN